MKNNIRIWKEKYHNLCLKKDAFERFNSFKEADEKNSDFIHRICDILEANL